MPFHIDYRPQTLKDVEGNLSTVESLQSVLSRDKKDIPHVYLLSGNRGCGKTTMGRIIKNELGCSDSDYKELDMACFRGINDIRAIRKQTSLKPMGSGGCRVWLLDEAHMIGDGGASAKNEAQNALLKILEDTPESVYFILCTTNPEGLLPTIRSRCMQFTVAPLGERQMVRLLKKIVESEKAVNFPPEAYQMIHKSSLGHVRDALQILEKIIDLPTARILKSIEEVACEESKLIELCQALLKQETWKSVSKIIRELPEKEEPESMRRAILAYMTSVLLKSDHAQAAICIDAFKEPFYNSGKAGLVLACYEAVK